MSPNNPDPPGYGTPVGKEMKLTGPYQGAGEIFAQAEGRRKADEKRKAGPEPPQLTPDEYKLLLMLLRVEEYREILLDENKAWRKRKKSYSVIERKMQAYFKALEAGDA